MPSLADTLANLSQQSAQIHYLSSLNSRPAGPFVQTYLHPDPNPSTSASTSTATYKPRPALHLIRDAEESEVRLFKFIGEGDNTGAGGGGGGGGLRRIEKREGGVVTPLRELRAGRSSALGAGGGGGGKRDEVGVMLLTALRLVDDYRPMPRARAHVASLLDTHQKQLDRIAQLEQLIQEANDPNVKSFTLESSLDETQIKSTEMAREDRLKLGTDEAIKAEETALKALEASLAPLRSKATEQEEPVSTQSPPSHPKPNNIDRMDHSPSPPPIPTMQMQTPARQLPTVTNSLVNGPTPRQNHHRESRFSPLRFLGTPRAPVGLSSGLRTVSRGDEDGIRPIFGRVGGRNTSMSMGGSRVTPARVEIPAEPGNDDDDEDGDGDGEVAGLEEQERGMVDEDETVRMPVPVKNAQQEGVEEQADIDDTAAASPVKPESEAMVRPRMIEGVEVDQEGVTSAVEKIWTTLGEMMRQGTSDDKPISTDLESSIKHLARLSRSDPAPPPSPSNTSTLSSLSSTIPQITQSRPLTTETILLAYLLLSLLRAYPTAAIAMIEVKENLASVSRARGWDGAEGLTNKVIFTAVGKKIIRIDRRGKPGGSLRFAE